MTGIYNENRYVRLFEYAFVGELMLWHIAKIKAEFDLSRCRKSNSATHISMMLNLVICIKVKRYVQFIPFIIISPEYKIQILSAGMWRSVFLPTVGTNIGTAFLYCLYSGNAFSRSFSSSVAPMKM